MSNKLINHEKLKPCPFCGGKVQECIGATGLLYFCCTNYNSCGAIMSFDQAVANKFPERARMMYNRRVTK